LRSSLPLGNAKVPSSSEMARPIRLLPMSSARVFIGRGTVAVPAATRPSRNRNTNETRSRRENQKNCRRLRSARGLSRSGEDPVGSNCRGPSADVLVRVSGHSHQQISRFGRVPVGGEGGHRAFCTAPFSIGSSSRLGRAVFGAKVGVLRRASFRRAKALLC
jgi:hypothetical protein